MSLPVFLAQIDSDDLTSLQALARLGPVLIPSAKLEQIKKELPANAPYYVEGSDDDLISYLDQGALKIVVSREQLEKLDGAVTEDKVVLKIAESEISALGDKALLASVSAVLIDLAEGDSLPSKDAVKSHVSGYSKPTFFRGVPASSAVELIRQLYSSSTTVVISTSSFSSSTLTIADAFLAPINSDRPDGLFPTVVSSYLHTSRSLGLVYSSRESIAESINTGKGVYQSRKHGLWRKGETSGAVQEVVSIKIDCDADALEFSVIQHGSGFCHLGTATCFGSLSGIGALEDTLQSRFKSAPEKSYTRRLFNDEKLLRAKIMEEAEELCDAETKDQVAFEAADLVYFALARCVSKGVSLVDVERALDAKARKVTRRRGDAKPKFEEALKEKDGEKAAVKEDAKPAEPVPASFPEASSSAIDIRMRTSDLSSVSAEEYTALLRRPVIDSLSMIDKVKPIVQRVRSEGDKGLLALTAQFDRVEMKSNIMRPPFAVPGEDELPTEVRKAIDQAYANVKTFHVAQAEKEPLVVETMPGVVCSRFVRAIARVGLYVPGGTAILPSTAIMLGVPAQVAGCKEIVLATPPRKDGTISPEVLYVAGLVGATCILKAGGAQAVGAMAYGTESVPKVDKIFGPGNQWVTAAKMLVQNDTEALVAIDMPAGPSEVLVIADRSSNAEFVASDLLSQAEHGTDSQVVLLAIDLSAEQMQEIERQVDVQAKALPRVDIIREAIKKSLIVTVKTQAEAIKFSNDYAPEHLILHLEDAPGAVKEIENAGSIFVGPFSPESCGDYASGTNHTLPTYGYARQFSGVNTLSFQKHITSQELTAEGLKVLGPVVVTIAEREGLEAHANAVRVRLNAMGV